MKETLITAFSHLKEFIEATQKGPLSFYIERCEEIFDEFYKRCSPFRMGDIVRLKKAVDFEKDFGWSPWAEYLQVGCIGVVSKVYFLKGKFRVEIYVDVGEESRMFAFSEDDLELANPTTPESATKKKIHASITRNVGGVDDVCDAIIEWRE